MPRPTKQQKLLQVPPRPKPTHKQEQQEVQTQKGDQEDKETSPTKSKPLDQEEVPLQTTDPPPTPIELSSQESPAAQAPASPEISDGVEPPSQPAEQTQDPPPPPPAFTAKEQEFYDWLKSFGGAKPGIMLMYFDALKDQFDCDLEQLKSTVIIDKLEKDGSVVDTIEPSLWASCGITKPLHKIMLAKAISSRLV